MVVGNDSVMLQPVYPSLTCDLCNDITSSSAGLYQVSTGYTTSEEAQHSLGGGYVSGLCEGVV